MFYAQRFRSLRQARLSARIRSTSRLISLEQCFADGYRHLPDDAFRAGQYAQATSSTARKQLLKNSGERSKIYGLQTTACSLR